MLQNAEEVVKPQSEFIGTEEDANDSEQHILQFKLNIVLEQELSENNEENRAEFEKKDESVISKEDQNGTIIIKILRMLATLQNLAIMHNIYIIPNNSIV